MQTGKLKRLARGMYGLPGVLSEVVLRVSKGGACLLSMHAVTASA